MQKLLLLGDEAIAQAAIDAGISGVYAYPGTPSTEITEYIQKSKVAKERNIKSTWSANEKTALEGALGMSYAGKRALACMKHVGLNVAADPFMNMAITGVNGGLVILVADDPSMHSSQDEQDSRYYGKFALMPTFEPSNQQEAYDIIRFAFEYSEKYEIPVLVRVTTRLAHSRSGVQLAPIRDENENSMPKNLRQFILLPANARVQYNKLIEKQTSFEKEAEESSFNQFIEGEDKSMGIVACGIGYNYLLENFPNGCPYPILKISQYPTPRHMVEKLYNSVDKIIVIEDGYPFVEEQIRGVLDNGKEVLGRLDGTLPRTGELNPDHVARAFGIDFYEGAPVPEIVKPRPPAMCVGCSHIDSYNALNEVMEKYGDGRVFSDIGCYTLGALPPFNAINSCVDMGASITMAKGAADAGLVPAVAVIGDSTFTHSGMTSLLDAINDNSPITVLILDNSTAGMTGGQTSSAFGKIEQICLGLGVDPEHLHVIRPLKKFHAENVEIIAKEVEYNGLSVIIPTRECIQTLNRRMRQRFKDKENKSK
ncbi:MAG: thiamine pyrophosphate-dependent enzyme [Bacteroidales bacterium]|jgi:indolepyruvate ferredoxin oxidoreductase alpha subunit|nr:indolepyruvate ferredoxin oxidoreductase [Bacteroidales bacterium]